MCYDDDMLLNKYIKYINRKTSEIYFFEAICSVWRRSNLHFYNAIVKFKNKYTGHYTVLSYNSRVTQ